MSTATLHIEKKKALIPELRFPEFDGKWKEDELGNITNWASGGTPPKDNPLFWDGDIPWISASSMRGIVYSDSELKITNAGLKKGSKLVRKGSLLILVRGSMLFNKIPIGIVSRDVSFNQDVKSIVVDGNYSTSEFILNWFTAFEPKILNMVTGTGIGAGKLDLPDLKALKISLPTLPEQQKIASFLNAVDEKIQQFYRKKELLEQYKKGIMQQLFSGKLRFKDENGKDYADWNYKKITDISKTSIGLVTTMTTSYVEIGIPLIRNSDIKENRINKNKLIYLDVDFATKHKHKKFSLGDIVTVHTGEVGVSAVIDDSLVGSLGFATLNTKVNKKIALPEFVCLYYNTIAYINYAVSMSTGDGRSNYNLKDFDKAVIPIPSLDEQKKIAEFINAIYDKIESTSQQIIQMRSFKKGLLQQLFV